MLLEKSLALVARKWKAAVPSGKRVKESARFFANALSPPQQCCRAELEGAQHLICIAGQLFEAVIRYLPAEIIAGSIFHLVSFIEDHRGIFRENAAKIVLLEREVRKKQMMVDDDQIGFFGALMHGGHEAF